MKELINELKSLQSEIEQLEDKIKERISSINDIAKEVALYIKIKDYPTEIYPVFGNDPGIYDNYKNINLKIVHHWGYTDIIGLTKEEFTRVGTILRHMNDTSNETNWDIDK